MSATLNIQFPEHAYPLPRTISNRSLLMLAALVETKENQKIHKDNNKSTKDYIFSSVDIKLFSAFFGDSWVSYDNDDRTLRCEDGPFILSPQNIQQNKLYGYENICLSLKSLYRPDSLANRKKLEIVPGKTSEIENLIHKHCSFYRILGNNESIFVQYVGDKIVIQANLVMFELTLGKVDASNENLLGLEPFKAVVELPIGTSHSFMQA